MSATPAVRISIDRARLQAHAVGVVAAAERHVPAAMRRWSWNVVREAKANVPVKTARLKNSIRPEPVVGSISSGWEVDVLAGGVNGVSYAPHVEFGTAAHVIKTKPSNRPARTGGRRGRGRLRFESPKGQFRFAKEVHHPGTTARSFMRNAVEAQMNEGARLVADAVERSFAEGMAR